MGAGVFVVDPEGCVRFWNRRVVSELGVPVRAALGRRLSEVLQPGVREAFQGVVEEVLRTGCARSLHLVPHSLRGGECALNLDAFPLQWEGGGCGALAVVMPAGEGEVAAHALRLSSVFLTAFFKGVSLDAVCSGWLAELAGWLDCGRAALFLAPGFGGNTFEMELGRDEAVEIARSLAPRVWEWLQSGGRRPRPAVEGLGEHSVALVPLAADGLPAGLFVGLSAKPLYWVKGKLAMVGTALEWLGELIGSKVRGAEGLASAMCCATPVASLVFDLDTMEVVEANIAARALLEGAGDRALVGRRVDEVLPPEAFPPALFEPGAVGGFEGPLVSVEVDGTPLSIVPSFALPEVVGGKRLCQLLCFDVTDRMVFEERLREANEALARAHAKLAALNARLLEADLVKERMLANVSHELRTPLNAILGFSEMLIDGLLGQMDDTAAHYVGMIHESGIKLLESVDKLMSLSAIRFGKVKPVNRPFDVGELVRERLAVFEQRIQAKDLEVRCAAESVRVVADRGLCAEILNSLIDNAVKFTPQGGRIDVTVHRHGRAVTVSVKDTGPGMDRVALEKAFEEFWQEDGSSTRKFSGVGVGLAIAKKLAELQGCRLMATSQPGKGSTFQLVLLAAEHAEEPEVVDV